GFGQLRHAFYRRTRCGGCFQPSAKASLQTPALKEKLFGSHQNGLSIVCEYARPKTFLTDRFVVVTSIAGPAGHKFERRLPSIGHAVSYVSRNIMKASWSHPFRPGPPSSVHHDQHSSSFDATVILCAVALHVEMTVRHEIFVSDSSRLDDCCAPKETACSSFRNGRIPVDSVNYGIQIHRF